MRERAAGAISGVLEKNVRLFSRITNTLVKDKQIEDEWRKFERPISSRNLANQVEDEVVEALIQAVRGAYPRISHRYYALKARWLGLDRLEFWDRNAPLPEDADTRRPGPTPRSWCSTPIAASRRPWPTSWTRFFEGSWIDAQLRPGKDSGAFCHPTVPSAHPYVLMNYQGRNRDVMTLAHELGHGVHQVLAARQGPLMASTPLTLAETASVFGEQLTFQALLAQETDPVRRRVLLAAKIEDKINTVVRQIAFCEFERRVHDARGRPSSRPTISAAVDGRADESLGPAFHFREDYRFYWTYIPISSMCHSTSTPSISATAWSARSTPSTRKRRPASSRAISTCSAGGTLRHKELLAPFGLDASDPGFWAKGLGLLEG